MSKKTILGITAAAILSVTAGAGYSLASDRLGGTDVAHPVPPSLEHSVELAKSVAPVGQQPALSDGQVTIDEHEAAIERTAGCLAAEGVAVEVKPGKGMRATSIGFAAPTIADGEVAREKLERCKEEHLTAIEHVWLAQVRPSAEAEQRARNFLGQCLSERGVPSASTDVSVEQEFEWITSDHASTSAAVGVCLEQREEEFGF